MTHHHHHSEAGAAADEAAEAELLDLDGAVLAEYWAAAVAWVAGAVTVVPQRVLDLGAGTGNGTMLLAQRFPDAEVVAIDLSEPMLARIRGKAIEQGLADRIRTVQADLDAGLPAIGAVDLTWASMSLHHLGDPDRVLGDVAAATPPGGVVAVAEFDEQLRFLPDDVGVGQPGLEARGLDALKDEHSHELPHLGSDWQRRLETAGLPVVSERAFVIDLGPPHSPDTVRYATRWIDRLRTGLGDRLAQDDLDALAVLLDTDGPESLRRRDDLHVHGTRTVTLGRRA
jgi:SAM-dependent methyltransferase